MNTSVLIRKFGRRAELLRRAAGSRNEHGEWVQGAETAIPVVVATAPREVQRSILDSGSQTTGMRSYWIDRPVFAETDDSEGDYIRLDSVIWKIQEVEPWSEKLFEFRAERAIPQTTARPSAGTTALERAIRAHVAAGSGIAARLVVPADDTGPRPPALYASVQIESDVQRGTNALTNFNPKTGEDDFSADTAIQRLASVRVMFLKRGARTAANRFLAWSESPDGIDAEQQRRFAVQRPINVSEQNQVVAGYYEQVTVMVLQLQYALASHYDRFGIDEYGLTVRQGATQQSSTIRRNP